jgi:hypothetical protein
MFKIKKLLDVGHRWVKESRARGRAPIQKHMRRRALFRTLHVQQVTSHASHAGKGAMHEMHTTQQFNDRDAGGFQSRPRGIGACVKK